MERSRTILLAFTVALFGCSQPDQLELTAQEVGLAIAARDADGVARHHVLTSQANPYCASSEFSRVLDQVKAVTSKQTCEKFQAAPNDKVDRLDDEARLLYQISRLVCEDPQMDCGGYADHVLRSTLKTDSLWSRPLGRPSIAKTIRNEDHAVVYMEFSGPPPVVRNLNFKKFGERWLLQDGFPEGP